MDWTFDPLWPKSLLLLVVGVGTPLFAWMAWRAAPGLARGPRLALLAVRTFAFACAMALLFNPGRWEAPTNTEEAGWALLLDRSGSMEVADEGDQTRSAAAAAFARQLLDRSRDRGRVEKRTFAEALGPLWEEDEDTPSGSLEGGTRLDRAGASLLDEAASGATAWTGLLVLGDGRQTGGEKELESFSARARALGLPVHVVPFGGEVKEADAELSLVRRQFVSLPNQEVTVVVKVKNEGLPPTRFHLRLLDAEGAEKGTLELEAKTGETVSGEWVLAAGSPGGDYRVEMASPEGDEQPANDAASFSLRILDKRTRVLLIEGSPYWDTKFLAQLLREQGLMDVEAIYRIQAGRFYRVSTGDTAALRETSEIFPETEAELGRYDLVVLGKGAEAFLDEVRVARLIRFVRQRGGSLLFSRGKPYTGEFAGLAPLEPGRWGEETRASYTFLPTGDGEESGLFGDRLPARDSEVWADLSPLDDVRTLAEIGPFTRVLAAGERIGGGAKVPLLLARRHGRGMVAAVNGDGIWRWGFQADDESADWHREFWMQVLQWAATYSEFLPGEDYSLHLSDTTIRLGETTRARIGWRGEVHPAPEPILEWSGPEKGTVAAAESGTAEDGTPRWGGILAPPKPGTYRVTLKAGGEEGPSLPLTVLPPTQERDERSSDPGTLARVAESTGGSVWSVAQVDELIARLEPRIPPRESAERVWRPLWNRSWIFGALALLLSGEWGLRRRFGLL